MGIHPIFPTPNFLVSLIPLRQNKIFQKFDNSRLKLTKKSSEKTIFRNSCKTWYYFVSTLGTKFRVLDVTPVCQMTEGKNLQSFRHMTACFEGLKQILKIKSN